MATEAASLSVGINFDTAQLDKSLSTIDKKLQGFSKNMKSVGKGMTKYATGPIVAAAAGFLGLATKAGNFADTLLDLEAATGISTDQLQRFRVAEVAAGVSTDSMADSINRMNRQMLEGGEFATRLVAVAGEYGVALKDSSGAARNAADVHHDLMMALAGIEDPQERARAGAQAFGRDWEAVAPVVALGREELERLYETDVISKENLNQANDFRVEMDMLKHELGQAAMQAGASLAPAMIQLAGVFTDKVVPVLMNLLDGLASLANWFADLSPTTQVFIGVMVGLVAAIGPMLIVTANLINAFTILKPALMAAGAAVAGLSAPVAIAIAAVVALIAIGVALYKNWDTVMLWAGKLKDYLIQTWDNIKTGVSEKVTAVKYAISDGISDALEFVTGLGSDFMEAGEGLVQSITDGIKNMAMAPVNAVKDMAGKIRNMLPFSPAKEGPLKDLDKLDFGGPIVSSIRHDIGNVQGAMGDMLTPSPAGAGTGGGTANIYFDVDGRTMAKIIGQPLTDEIRLKTGMRL